MCKLGLDETSQKEKKTIRHLLSLNSSLDGRMIPDDFFYNFGETIPNSLLCEMTKMPSSLLSSKFTSNRNRN